MSPQITHNGRERRDQLQVITQQSFIFHLFVKLESNNVVQYLEEQLQADH